MNCSRIPSLLCACGVALVILGTPFDSGTCWAQCTSCGVGYGTATALTTYTPAYSPRPSRRGPGYNIASCATCKPRTYLAVPQVIPRMNPPAVYVPQQTQPCSLPTCTPTYCTPTYCTPTYCAPTCDPCGGTQATCYRPVTAYRPLTTWVARPSLVPYISYRQPWPRMAYPTSYAYYGTRYVAPVTSCVSGCNSCALNGRSASGCSSCGLPPLASTSEPYYPGASNSVSPADITPSLPSSPAAVKPVPKTFEKPIAPEAAPKSRSTLKPIPESATRNTPATPKLIDPYGRTTSLPIRQASYFRTIPNTPQPVTRLLGNDGWRAASD